MRIRNLASTPATTSILPSLPPPVGPDSTATPGLHGVRLVDGVLLDFPMPASPGSRCWVATIWPDARVDAGWARIQWQLSLAQGRGWLWPPRIAVGDIIEFGVETGGRRRKRSTTRSFGVIVDYDGSWLLSMRGPYADPVAAHGDAVKVVQDRQAPVALPPPPQPPASVLSRHRGRVSTHSF